jgi:ribokinase
MTSVGGVAVVGSINADLTAYTSALPRPGETIIGEHFDLVLGGKGANQAVAAVRAGAATYLVAAVGNDLFRSLTLDLLTAEGIDTSAVEVLGGHTGIAHIRVDTTTGQNDIVVVPNANYQLTPEQAAAAVRSLRDRVAVVLVQLEIQLPVVIRVAEVCRELGLPLVLDPAPAQPLPDEIWPMVSVVKPNELEAEVLTGIAVDDAITAEWAGRWFLERGAQAAVITMAERGVLVVDATAVRTYPAFQVQPVDTTAAGDAFAGVLGASLAQGLDLEEAVCRSLAAGALSVTVRGASPSLPSATQIDDFLDSQSAG